MRPDQTQRLKTTMSGVATEIRQMEQSFSFQERLV